jgi:hypothetical protein
MISTFLTCAPPRTPDPVGRNPTDRRVTSATGMSWALTVINVRTAHVGTRRATRTPPQPKSKHIRKYASCLRLRFRIKYCPRITTCLLTTDHGRTSHYGHRVRLSPAHVRCLDFAHGRPHLGRITRKDDPPPMDHVGTICEPQSLTDLLFDNEDAHAACPCLLAHRR